MTEWTVRIGAATHRGLVKPRNEDTVLIGDWLSSADTGRAASIAYRCDGTVPLVVAVCDGLGGHPAGDEASQFAASELQRQGHLWTDEGDVIHGLRAIAHQLEQLGRAHSSRARMGTTVAGVCVQSNRVLVFNVGDSPVYTFGNGLLTQLSVDDEALGQPGVAVQSGLITASLGPHGAAIDPHVLAVPLDERQPSTFVLCSDGVSDFVSLARIEDILAASPDAVDAAAAEILAAAFHAGAPDNVSIAIVRLDTVPESQLLGPELGSSIPAT